MASSRSGPRGAPPRPSQRLLLAAALGGALLLPSPAQGQSVLERTPNLTAGWVGQPGAVHFHLLHRFWRVGPGTDDKLLNSPTLHAAAPIAGGFLAGLQYASNSLVAGDFNEWEASLRWAPPLTAGLPLRPAATVARNASAGSVDGELSVALVASPGPLRPDALRVVGAVRMLGDAFGSGESGTWLGGGAVVRISDGVALAADAGSLRGDGPERGRVWGAAIQLRIPTTPHTMSVQATNTRTGTLQGSSLKARTMWGFEFTVPITAARYLGRRGPAVAASQPDDETAKVAMTDDLRFLPDTVRIPAGGTVEWTNGTPLPHTVTAHPERVRDPAQVELPDGAAPFDSGFMFTGDTFRHTFETPGVYRYVCVPHDEAGMTGVVVVSPP